MKITVIKPKAIILSVMPERPVEALEEMGRTCYKSEGCIKEGSADRFVRMICRNHHESVLEHASMSARVVCSRACSHQLVRHRIGSYSQESQRYVNYSKRGYEVICPPSIGVEPGAYVASCHPWLNALRGCFEEYEAAFLRGAKPEDARYILPNACKTEVVVTYNFRTWRHVFRERALNPHAQWEIREIMLGLYKRMVKNFPSVFEDLENDNN
jgi:thymidylate synthase (FAD)